MQIAHQVADADVDEFKRMLEVNVTGTFLVTRAVSALMRAQDPRPVDAASPTRGMTRGAIVNMGSASSFVATPGMIQYTTAKHAVLGITKNAGMLRQISTPAQSHSLTLFPPCVRPRSLACIE